MRYELFGKIKHTVRERRSEFELRLGALHQANIIGLSAGNDYVVNLSQSAAQSQLRERIR